jgi:hypothetical protein
MERILLSTCQPPANQRPSTCTATPEVIEIFTFYNLLQQQCQPNMRASMTTGLQILLTGIKQLSLFGFRILNAHCPGAHTTLILAATKRTMQTMQAVTSWPNQHQDINTVHGNCLQNLSRNQDLSGMQNHDPYGLEGQQTIP